MPQPVTSDTLLQARATSLRATLNVGHVLKLFTNNLVPLPQTPRSSFVNASFAGYSPIALAYKWGEIVRAQPGQWCFATPPLVFTRTGGPDEIVYGWWIDNGTTVPFAFRFLVPIDTSVQATIPVGLRFCEWSRSLFD